MENLKNQLSDFDIKCVATLLGFDEVSCGFTNTLYDMPPLPKGFTLGQVTVAYLEHKLNYFKSFK